MEDIFRIKVDDTMVFERSKADLEEIDLLKDDKAYHILHKNKAFKAEIINSDLNKKEYTLMVNSRKFTVKIEDSLDIQIEKLGLNKGKNKHANNIIAPIPGVIKGINVKEGDLIKEGDPLLILEAMKMENTISSHRDAVVKKISVGEGHTVEKGNLLIEFV